MPKYIDADKINAKLMDEYHGMISDESMKIYKIMQMLDNAPAADVEEVRHGKWTIRHEGTYKRAKCYCSVCGKSNGIGGIISNQKKQYCPNCGAKMDLEDNKGRTINE